VNRKEKTRADALLRDRMRVRSLLRKVAPRCDHPSLTRRQGNPYMEASSFWYWQCDSCETWTGSLVRG
jgi:hypothetical protein